MYRTKFLLNDYPVAAYADAGPPSVDSGFVSGVLPAGWAYTRADSVATDCVYMDGSTVTTYTTFAANQPRFLPFGLLMEPSRTNYFLNSEAPTSGSKTVTLALGTYTMWYLGTQTNLIVTAITAAMIPSVGQATPGVPYTFQVTTAGTVNVAVAVGVLRVQIENGPDATSYILSGATAVTRAEERLVQNFSAGFLNASQGTYWVEFMLATASMPPNPAAARLFTAGGGSFTSNNNTDQVFFTNTGSNAAFGSTYNASGGGITTTFIVPPKVGNVSRAAMSVSPTRNQMAMDYVLGTASAASYRPPSLLAVTLGNGGNPTGAPQAFNGYIRGFKYWPVAMPDAELKECTGAGYYRSTPLIDLDFTQGVLPRRLTFNHSDGAGLRTNSFFTDAPGSTYTTFAANVPMLTPQGLICENVRWVFIPNSNVIVGPYTINLNNAIQHVLWMVGTGSISIAAAGAVGTGFGTATQNNPLYFNITTVGNVTVTATGSVNRAQIEWLSGTAATPGTPSGLTSFYQNTAVANAKGSEWYMMSAANWMPADQVTYYVELVNNAFVNGRILSVGADGVNYDGIYNGTGFADGTFTLRGNTIANAVNQGPIEGQSIHAPGSFAKAAYVASSSRRNFAVNGKLLYAPYITGLTRPSTPTSLGIGTLPGSGSGPNQSAFMILKRVRIYDYAMTDNEIAALTDNTLDASLDLVLTGPSLDPRIVLTRANANATYFDVNGTLLTAAANAPRFAYDPVTHVARGLLIEEQRTNYAFQSGNMSAAPWTALRATATASAAASPDGLTNAVRITEDTTASQSHFTNAVVASVQANQPVTASVYLRNGNRRYAQLAIYDNTTTVNTSYVDVDLVSGTIGTQYLGGAATAGYASITSVGNGWYRVSVTATLSAAATTGVIHRVLLCNALAGNVYTGDGASNLYVWGAQVEPGSFPTSYVATAAGIATRSADLASMPTAGGWYDATQGSLIAECWHPHGSSIQAAHMAAAFTDGTTANRIQIGGNPFQNTQDFEIWSGSASQFLVTPTGLLRGQTMKFGISYSVAGGLAYAYANGVAGPIGALSLMPVGINSLSIGRLIGAFFNGYVSRIRYYPRVLSAAQMQQLTT